MTDDGFGPFIKVIQNHHPPHPPLQNNSNPHHRTTPSYSSNSPPPPLNTIASPSPPHSPPHLSHASASTRKTSSPHRRHIVDTFPSFNRLSRERHPQSFLIPKKEPWLCFFYSSNPRVCRSNSPLRLAKQGEHIQHSGDKI